MKIVIQSGACCESWSMKMDKVEAWEPKGDPWQTVHVLCSVMRIRPLTISEQDELHEAHLRIREAEALREQAGAVPEGWKLVPVEATEPMLESGCNQHECEQGDPYYSSPPLSEHDARAIYAAMIAAAPSQPVEQAAGGGGDDAMVERVAIAIYAAKRGFSMAIARDRWANVEQKSRFIGPARDALMGG